jgi:hypothetical protein
VSDAKKLILARRARFIAAAVASVGIACGKKDVPPQPCLSEPMIRDDAEAPQPCLSVAIPTDPLPPDAEPPRPCLSIANPNTRPDAGTTTAKPKPPLPQKCLSIAKPPENHPPAPVPCLKADPGSFDDG